MKPPKPKINLDLDALFDEVEIKHENQEFFNKLTSSSIIEMEISFGIYFPNFIESENIPSFNTPPLKIKFSSNDVQKVLTSQRELVPRLKQLQSIYKFCKETKELLDITFYLETKQKAQIQEFINTTLKQINYDKFKKTFVSFGSSNNSPTLQYQPILKAIEYIESKIIPLYIKALNQWEINYIKLNLIRL